MAISGELQKNRNIFQRATQALRYGRDLDPIENYQVGDIQSEQGVVVLPDAAVVGDIEAPKVIIFGLVYGFIAAREVVVEEGGQVWGDVFTAAFHLKAGGKVHGWISSPAGSEGDLDSSAPNGANGSGKEIVSPELQELAETNPEISLEKGISKERAAIWRQLQTEAAGAIMARRDLEQRFEARVDEVAGKSMTESSRLRDEVLVFREERSALMEQVEALEEEVANQKEYVDTKSAELAAVQSLLDDQNASLEELQAVFEQQNLKYAAFDTERRDLKTNLAQEKKGNSQMLERIANLESALQASLQHTAEQEEALIRWQELAEITENRAKALENELETIKLQLKESTQVVDLLRTQRDKLQAEWEKADQSLKETSWERKTLHSEISEKSKKLATLEEEQQTLQESLSSIQERFNTHPPDYDQLREKLEMVTANNAEILGRLRRVESEARDYHEQWLWTKASLDTTYSELETKRETVEEYEETILRMRSQISENEKQVETWKNSVGRMTDLLYEAESRVKEMEKNALAAAVEAENTAEKEALQDEIRKQQLQIEAYEAEVTSIHGEIEGQSRRLAELQSTLVERDVALGQALETAEKQAAQSVRVKQMAGTRIRALEAELAETQQKLKDLSVWLERHQKRGDLEQ